MRQGLGLGRIKEMIFWVIDSSLESSSWGIYGEGILISTFFSPTPFSIKISCLSFFSINNSLSLSYFLLRAGREFSMLLCLLPSLPSVLCLSFGFVGRGKSWIGKQNHLLVAVKIFKQSVKNSFPFYFILFYLF